VTDYIDTMLGSLGSLGSLAGSGGSQGSGAPAPMIFAGGPWSNRHTSGPDLMASFISLDPVAQIAWRRRLTGWQQQYRQGIATLDQLAGGDFTKATQADQDKILARQAVSTFTALLFEHTIEGLYAAPEYGGNRGLAGWKDIAFPGDIQPRGYTADEVSRSDGPDPVDNTGVVAEVLKFLGAL
jgi:Gluconate 2-dehydrogenase subunit 3